MDASLQDAHCHPGRSSVCCGMVASGGSRGNNMNSQLHSEPLGRSLPLFLYPTHMEQRVYDGSYYSGASLLSYLPPFHGSFGVYDCTFEPAFIQKRNERERQRVKCVNQGYAKLRDHLPNGTTEKRLSKLETLRAAIQYIKYLQGLVENTERVEENGGGASPVSVSESSSEESAWSYRDVQTRT
ncbi:achaete-scute homolog 5-like [Myxocyprinus asiaticus]|uniref:achaete-scute homolog 5-like n=1 Tax=Myxocyprinus asiaticus TaxID=70543 RepID=UPI002223B961|nr:achaete-scute homolog 5-like [Myxocyprinus asiaticus]